MGELTKITFAVTNDLSYDQRMARICGTLHEAGYDVTIVGRRKKTAIPLENKSFRQYRLNCLMQKGKLFYFEYNIRLFLYLLFHYTDIISSVDTDTLPACALVSMIKSRKLVFDAHEYFTEVPEVTERKAVKRLWEKVAKIFIPYASKVYTVNESLAEIFSNKYDKKFEVIRNVPETREMNSDGNSNDRIILYQGALNEGRGLEQSIMAMKEIEAELWIAGEGDLSEFLRELVREHQLELKVKFLGYVKPEELKKITIKAKIGLNVLQQQGLSYYYSLSNKFFDYMHAGVPQVCAPFPEYRHINHLHEVALLCDCNVKSIAGAVNLLITDDALYNRLHENCITAKKEFCWEREKEKLITIYRNAAN